MDISYKITQGAKPFQVGKGKPKQTRDIVQEKPYVAEIKVDEKFVPLLRDSLMNRYTINWAKNYWISFGDWLAEPRYSANYFVEEKIIVRQTGDCIIATLDCEKFVVRDNLYTILPRSTDSSLHYLLSLLNSKFLTWVYQNLINPEVGEVLAQVKRTHIALLPIPHPPRYIKDELIKNTKAMLSAKQQLSLARTESDKNFLTNKCNSIDRQIDKLVYELYGLTDEEVRVVEGR